MLKDLLDHGIGLFFPKNCRFCGDPFRGGVSNILCEKCWYSIRPYQDPRCPHCGVSLLAYDPDEPLTVHCVDCDEGIYSLDETWSFGPYEGALRIAHHAFKFEGMQSLSTEMAARMSGSIQRPNAECIVPVPLFPVKEREKGYNPAFDLADALSRLWNLPVRTDLRKIKNTPAQMSLPQKERLKSPKGAFSIKLSGKIPKTVLLVDDVFTTGATLEECAGILKTAGADRVSAVVWGRTPKNFSL